MNDSNKTAVGVKIMLTITLILTFSIIAIAGFSKKSFFKSSIVESKQEKGYYARGLHFYNDNTFKADLSANGRIGSMSVSITGKYKIQEDTESKTVLDISDAEVKLECHQAATECKVDNTPNKITLKHNSKKRVSTFSIKHGNSPITVISSTKKYSSEEHDKYNRRYSRPYRPIDWLQEDKTKPYYYTETEEITEPAVVPSEAQITETNHYNIEDGEIIWIKQKYFIPPFL